MRVSDLEPGTARVVVLEDGRHGCSVAAALATGGFDVMPVSTCARTWRAIAREAPVFVVLDTRASDASIRFLTRLRVTGSSMPVLAVCPRGEDHSVAALNAGADECVSPPYLAIELIARARALLRRAYGPAEWRPTPIRVGRLVVCPMTRQATRDGVPVHLSPKELGLLLALIENRGRVMARRELHTRVWPERATPNRRTIDTHIRWLRQKIEADHCRPRIIRTVPRVGYFIASPRD